MSHEKYTIDPEVLAFALKKCNGSWIQKAILSALLANIGIIIYGIGLFMVNNRLLQDAIMDLREMKVNYHRMDKELAQTQVTVQGHDVRIISLENQKNTKTRN